MPERTAVIFQDARLLPWMTALDNVLLGLGLGRGERSRGERLLAEVGLAGRETAWPHELSGGEQQRVALARALIHEPALLLADEPFGALDALTRGRMHGLLKRLSEVHDPAILLVTHDIDEAILLADRIVIIEDGVLSFSVQVTSPHRSRDERSAEIRDQLLTRLGAAAHD